MTSFATLLRSSKSAPVQSGSTMPTLLPRFSHIVSTHTHVETENVPSPLEVAEDQSETEKVQLLPEAVSFTSTAPSSSVDQAADLLTQLRALAAPELACSNVTCAEADGRHLCQPQSLDIQQTLASQSGEPGASAASLLTTDLCRPGVLVRTGGGCTHVHWAVDAKDFFRKLDRHGKHATSPVFMIPLPNHRAVPFRIMLDAKAPSDGKKGTNSTKVQGCGRVVLKCETELPRGCSGIAFRIGIGRDDVVQPFRGPIVQSFSDHCCQGLQTADEEWDLGNSIDQNKQLVVTLEVAAESAYAANPNLWWAALGSVPDIA